MNKDEKETKEDCSNLAKLARTQKIEGKTTMNEDLENTSYLKKEPTHNFDPNELRKWKKQEYKFDKEAEQARQSKELRYANRFSSELFESEILTGKLFENRLSVKK